MKCKHKGNIENKARTVVIREKVCTKCLEVLDRDEEVTIDNIVYKIKEAK